MLHYRCISHYAFTLRKTPKSQHLKPVSKFSNIFCMRYTTEHLHSVKPRNVWSPVCHKTINVYFHEDCGRRQDDSGQLVWTRMTSVMTYISTLTNFASRNWRNQIGIMSHRTPPFRVRTVPNTKQYWKRKRQCKYKTCPHKVKWLHLVVMSGYVTVPVSQFTEGCEVETKQICE